MKAKPRWMKSVIATAAKYAQSDASIERIDTTSQNQIPEITDQA